MVSFGDLYNQSLKEYKSNFKIYFWILFLLVIIPSFLVGFFGIWVGEFYAENMQMTISYIGAMIVTGILSLLGSICIIAHSFNLNKKLDFGKTLSLGSKYFFNYLLFAIIYLLVVVFVILAVTIVLFLISYFNMVLFLFSLFLGIVGTAFLLVFIYVSWVFVPYFIVDGNENFISSMKKSNSLVSGKRWGVLGYLVLLLLIFLALMLLIMIPFGIIDYVVTSPYAHEGLLGLEDAAVYPYNIQIISLIITQIGNGIYSLIAVPLGILFLKNFYLSFKKKKKS